MGGKYDRQNLQQDDPIKPDKTLGFIIALCFFILIFYAVLYILYELCLFIVQYSTSPERALLTVCVVLTMLLMLKAVMR